MTMDEMECRKPDWLSGGELLDLPCNCEAALEDVPCAECCWYMPATASGTAPGAAG